LASRSKNKTTFAKLARESRLRERRMEKQARKEARRQAAEDPRNPPDDAMPGEDTDMGPTGPADDE
jgi:hypothetical protein